MKKFSKVLVVGQIKKMIPSNFRQRNFSGIVGFALVLTGIVFIWKVSNSSTPSKDLSRYTVSAEKGKLPGLISASGELQAIRRVNISPKRQGLIEEIYIKEGEPVLKDQLIAQMDKGDFDFRLKEQRAEFRKQKSDFERRQILFREGAISAEEYDKYKNLLIKSQSRLNQREVEGQELEIRAPFAGIITSVYAEKGSFVRQVSSIDDGGSKSSSIVELSQGISVVAKVPESDIGRIEVGQLANIKVDAFPDKNYLASVSKISPRAIKDNNVTSFNVKLLLNEEYKNLRIGMTTDVQFKTGETSSQILVPTVSIVTEEGEPGLLIVGDRYKPIFQKVELGTSSGSQTAIIKGIEPGDLVFIDLPPWAKRERN